jgi:phosphoglycolate phosphatase
MASIKIVITDLDNTIYNWVDFYIPSYLAMVEELTRLTGVPQERLKGSFKRLHERYRTTEYAFAVEMLDVLSPLNAGLSARQICQRYDSAIRAFRRKRKETLRLYDGVQETLVALRTSGKKIVAHTEALMFYASQRLGRLGVEALYDAIFAPPDHGFPEAVRPEDVRYFDDVTRYISPIPGQFALDHRLRKPEPAILELVLDRMAVSPKEAVYVGDSLRRDVIMAQRCGVWDVHARYGQAIDPRNYEELLKITYWSDEDRDAECAVDTRAVNPTFTIDRFPDLLSVVRALDEIPGGTGSPLPS